MLEISRIQPENHGVKGNSTSTWGFWGCFSCSKKEAEIFPSAVIEAESANPILKTGVIVPILYDDVFPSPCRQIALVVLGALESYSEDTFDNVARFYWNARPGLIQFKGVDFDYFVGLYHENVVTSDFEPFISEKSLKSGAHGTIRPLTLRNTSKDAEVVVALKTPTDLSKEGKRKLKLEVSSTEGVAQIKGAIQMQGRLFSDKLKLRGMVLDKFPNDMHDYIKLLGERRKESQENTTDVKQVVLVLKFLIDVLVQMDKCDKVHNDIKLENIVVDFDPETLEIKEMAVIDFSNTDPNNPVFIVSPFCIFPEEYQLVQELLAGVEYEGLNLVEMRKILDRRQAAVCIYEMVAVLLGVPSEPYPMCEVEFNGKVNLYPNPKGTYRDLPEEAGALLSSLIRDMLDPDFNKVPSVMELSDRVNVDLI